MFQLRQTIKTLEISIRNPESLYFYSMRYFYRVLGDARNIMREGLILKKDKTIFTRNTEVNEEKSSINQEIFLT